MAKEYRCFRAPRAIMGSCGSLPQGLPAPLPRIPLQPSQAVRCPMSGTGAALVALAAHGWWVGWAQAAGAWSDALGSPWWSQPPGKSWFLGGAWQDLWHMGNISAHLLNPLSFLSCVTQPMVHNNLCSESKCGNIRHCSPFIIPRMKISSM